MIVVKPIDAADLPQLGSIYSQLSDKQPNLSKMSDVYHVMTSNDQYLLLGAYVDGHLAGSVMGIVCHDLVGECNPFMVIENVIVTEAYRGQGVGKLLMLEMEHCAVERQCAYIIFVSGSQRKAAHQFYASIGYKLDRVQGFKKDLV